MSTTTVHAGGERQGLLRWGLLADAAFSGTAAMTLTVGAGFLAEPFGLSSTLLRVVGVSLLPYSAILLYLVSRLERTRNLVWGVVVANLIWAVASVLLLLTGWVDPTTMGIAFILGQAIAVAGFGEIQFFALRRRP